MMQLRENQMNLEIVKIFQNSNSIEESVRLGKRERRFMGTYYSSHYRRESKLDGIFDGPLFSEI